MYVCIKNKQIYNNVNTYLFVLVEFIANGVNVNRISMG